MTKAICDNRVCAELGFRSLDLAITLPTFWIVLKAISLPLEISDDNYS